MIDITRTDVYGFEAAIRGMRNPMNSWDKSDSAHCYEIDCDGCPVYSDGDCMLPLSEYIVGPNDLTLMTKLAKAGTEHSKYRRMIPVWLDITAPLYWWKEMDTYMIGTVRNSCSTMHKIHAKEFTLDDFSHEHLFNWIPDGEGNIFDTADTADELIKQNAIDVHEEYNSDGEGWYEGDIAIDILNRTIIGLNGYRDLYLKTKDKKYWWQMIQLLPSSYNQKRTVMLNYEVLAKIYRERKNHKLDEWHTFCDWIETLPYAKEIITMEEKVDES